MTIDYLDEEMNNRHEQLIESELVKKNFSHHCINMGITT